MADTKLLKAKAYAYRLINYRPRSQKELEKRLRDKGYNEQIINKLISDFKEEELIDDRSFARLWVRTRTQTSPRGPLAIKMELLSKEVDRDIVDDALEELKKNFNEEDVARDLLKRRLRLVAGLDRRKAKTRLFGYLKRRGFSNQVIYKLLDEIG